MIITETIAVDGHPVGRLIRDTNSQEIAFHPNVTPSPVPERDYASLEELRNAIVSAYRQGQGHE